MTRASRFCPYPLHCPFSFLAFVAWLNAGTIDRAIEQIDDWYSDNPGRKGDPVLGVVWQRMVKGR
ncbi:MAG: hypothetical protein OET16_01550 [Chromatiales bacterium]|nr:hypothetical protein [Chromatiales bacterium]PLX54608.1 MAG: hypothetical protein C0629_16840 [Chromatiales bacterium]